MFDEKRMIEKIRAVLALAQNNLSKEESQSAMLMAQKLMAEYRISKKKLRKPKESQVENKNMRLYSRLPQWQTELATVIARNFRCKSAIAIMKYEDSNQEFSAIRFYGHAEDIEMCTDVYNYAMKAVSGQANEYVRVHRNDENADASIRQDFIRGYIMGMDKKYNEQVNHNNWGLILVCPEDVIQEYDRNVNEVYRYRNEKIECYTKAIIDGYNMGEKFDTEYEGQMKFLT